MIKKKTSRKSPAYMKFSLWVVFIGIVVSLFILFKLYRAIFGPGFSTIDGSSKIIYIPTGSVYEDVVSILETEQIISDKSDIEWIAKKKNYPNNVKPGRYRIHSGINNNDLFNMLRSGRQETIQLSFNNLRTMKDLAERVSEQLEPDFEDFHNYFNSQEVIESKGFKSGTFSAMFIPNTYEFYWNTSPEDFVDRMSREYIAFWSAGREKKAAKLNLTKVEVITLASIIDQESLYDDENARIAGVFINRIRQKIPLQSDPTIIFALQDYSIKRVLNKHKAINSPYNTYKNRGLPPGPISIPSISAIDAVLNFEQHNYLYFCAKPDFSGYHNFASTLSQHNKNARLYQKALDQRKIYR
ncbi:MAG: endolytic transglycosylase MltG [Bacteroidales bacterium]|nr:endolytic transglycosylase MltG [Bacteroidales bacterium]MCF8391362.1 endolytic transglycosylase MltG [Bacteroidales bacterium]